VVIVFTFNNPNPVILERGVRASEMESKYPDKYMIVINGRFMVRYGP